MESRRFRTTPFDSESQKKNDVSLGMRRRLRFSPNICHIHMTWQRYNSLFNLQIFPELFAHVLSPTLGAPAPRDTRLGACRQLVAELVQRARSSPAAARNRNRLKSVRPLKNSSGVASKRGCFGTKMPDQVGHDGRVSLPKRRRRGCGGGCSGRPWLRRRHRRSGWPRSRRGGICRWRIP